MYDRAGRLNEVTQGTNSWVLNYNAAGQLLSETSTFAGVSGAIVSYGQDELLRRSSINFSLGSINLNTELRYDEASRLSVVSNGVYAAKYDYLPNSPLYGSISFSKNGLLVARTERNFDYLNRLNSIFTTNASGAVITSSVYDYNQANQRTKRTEADGSFWSYGYDNLGQVTSGEKSWNDGTPVAGQQFEYDFDDIGNRLRSAHGGNNAGLGLNESSYTPNLLNQISSRLVPGIFDVFGTAVTNATVTVNFERTERKGEYFHGLALLNNATNPVFQFITNIAVLNNGTNADIIATNLTGTYLPPSNESFTYDDDGNILEDGRWDYVWDAENRLVRMETRSFVPAGARKRLEFNYDYQGRRIWKRETDLDASTSAQHKFVYDGWNLVAELNASDELIQSFIWGLDLSGSFQGAGGVGGLLFTRTSSATPQFANYDGNGNVVALTDSSIGTRSAEYEYGPFGEVLRATGTLAEVNAFRFSTKYAETSDLVYFGHRHYSTVRGNWLNRDAIEESGGLNLYAYVRNSPLASIDSLGMSGWALSAPQEIWDSNYRSLTQSSEYQEGFRQGMRSGFVLGTKLTIAAVVGGYTAGAAAPFLSSLGTSTGFTVVGAGLIGGATGDATVQSLEIVTGERESYNVQQSAISALVGGGLNYAVNRVISSQMLSEEVPIKIFGNMAEEEALKDLAKARIPVRGRQVQFATPDGKPKVDILVEETTSPTGVKGIEVKAGDSDLTYPQEYGYPHVRAGNSTPTGMAAQEAGLPVGTPFGPTPVEVWRYDYFQFLRWPPAAGGGLGPLTTAASANWSRRFPSTRNNPCNY